MDSETEHKTEVEWHSPSTNCNSRGFVYVNPFAKYQCRDKNLLFEDQSLVGKGSYGNVYKAYYKKEEENIRKPVALKHIKVEREEKEGFPITAIREIQTLKKLKHKNIATLLEIVQEKPEKKQVKTYGKLQNNFKQRISVRLKKLSQS